MQLFIKLTKTQENERKCQKASKSGKKRQKESNTVKKVLFAVLSVLRSSAAGAVVPLKRRGGSITATELRGANS